MTHETKGCLFVY